MQYVADLHLHSKYSRAVSKDMVLPIMRSYALKKGIDIMTVADWTHPLWLREIKGQLEVAGEGVYKLKVQNEKLKVAKEPYFLLSTEISSIYSQGGQVRRIHSLMFAPNFEVVEKINKELVRRGCNLLSDGRPIVGLSAKNLIDLVLNIESTAMLIPCHAWTPWFSLYGSNSGFDSIDECFGDYGRHILAVESGLSSDPEMNWQVKELQNRAILSFSDAHSPAKMGREATVFELSKPSYFSLRRAIASQMFKGLRSSVERRPGQTLPTPEQLSENYIAYTLEFYPEEGKYHYTGHRNCNIIQTPEETKAKGDICPVCKKKLTVGVMHRVSELATVDTKAEVSSDKYGSQWFKDPTGNHPPFVKLVPLNEIIAESLESTVSSGKVKLLFDQLCEKLGSEIEILLRTSISDIAKVAGVAVAEGVRKVRAGDIVIEPGYDNTYGVVKIWQEGQEKKTIKEGKKTQEDSQLGLF